VGPPDRGVERPPRVLAHGRIVHSRVGATRGREPSARSTATGIAGGLVEVGPDRAIMGR